MYSILAIFTGVCLPILTLVGVGWLLDRKFNFDLNTLVKLNIYLFVPAFILVRLSTSEIPGKTGFLVMLFTACVIFAMGVISWIVSRIRRAKREEVAALQLSTMIYNSGNWGIPLLTLAFPGEGGVVQVFVLATMNLATFTVGVFLAKSLHQDSKTSIWRNLFSIFKLPSIYAISLAIGFRVWGNPIDEVVFLWRPLNYLADGLIGLALLTLGIQLSKTEPLKSVDRMGWALVIRLLGGPLVAIGLTWAFGLSGTFAAILIVGAASPTAVNTALLAYELGSDSRFASTAVYFSTLSATFVVALLLMIIHSGMIPWAIPGQ